MTNSDVFGHLLTKRYSVQDFATGHVAYDHFVASALKWEGGLRLREAAGGNDRSLLEREAPFLVQIEEEAAESLGRAMVINAYTMPKHGYDWEGWPSGMTDMGSFRQAFYNFTRKLSHARISADDATALLTEIPEALMRDEIQLFEELLFRSFPHAPPPSLGEALGIFLEAFYDTDILAYVNAKAIVARHERLWRYLGRDILDLSFYRERERVFDLARKQSARFVAKLGPVHSRFAAAPLSGDIATPQSRRNVFQAELTVASRAERGQMIADACRTLIQNASSAQASPWRRAGAPFLPSSLVMSQEDLVSQIRLPMDLTPDQACTILEYMARYGTRYASNYPTLDYPLAKRLARSLPVGRPDLERLVKETAHETDQAVKDVLIDALRGTRRGWLNRLLRRFVPRAFKPQDRPELWAGWIETKRQFLIAQIAARAPLGLAAPGSASVRDWGGIDGQVYDLDVVGYAKRIALAQSCGADVIAWLDDLRSLVGMIRANLQEFEAQLARTEITPPPPAVESMPGSTGAGSGQPSLFGLYAEPTPRQLAECERQTLTALDRLVARIELCTRHPDLIPFEARMRDMTKGQDFGGFHLILFAHAIEIATSDGVPGGLFERLDGFDFASLDGPYIQDTEPCFSAHEVHECVQLVGTRSARLASWLAAQTAAIKGRTHGRLNQRCLATNTLANGGPSTQGRWPTGSFFASDGPARS
jgi:hypothetical protein